MKNIKIEPREILKQAIEEYGENFQIEKAIEEMSELIFAIQKLKIGTHIESSEKKILELTENVVEEIADVSIMMSQLAIIFGEKPVNAYTKLKLIRLHNRVNNLDVEDNPNQVKMF